MSTRLPNHSTVSTRPRDPSAPSDWIAEAVAGLPPLATVEEAAEFLRVSTRTIMRYAAAGRLRGIRLGDAGCAKTVIPRDAIADFLRGRAGCI